MCIKLKELSFHNHFIVKRNCTNKNSFRKVWPVLSILFLLLPITSLSGLVTIPASNFFSMKDFMEIGINTATTTFEGGDLKTFKIDKTLFYTTFWIIISTILISTLGLFFIIRSFLNKKIKDQVYTLQSNEAIKKERSRIAADIHDDIGAELTNLVLLSRILKYSTGSDKEESMKIATKIESSSNEVITKMNQVIWTLNARNYTLKNLVAHVRNYIHSLTENKDIHINLFVGEAARTNRPLTSEFTGNVFLVIKELLQNAVKHSRADVINVNIKLLDINVLWIKYADNGVGFDALTEPEGNGLYNIRKRVNESKGAMDIISQPGKGCSITVIFPLKITSNEY